MTDYNVGYRWPQTGTGRDKKDAPVAWSEELRRFLCKSCWNGDHPRSGHCPVIECQCGCYHGRNRGLNAKIGPPAQDCTEQGKFPDVGGEFIGPHATELQAQIDVLNKTGKL